MLQKKYRLRTFKDFKRVFARGGFVRNNANNVIVLKFVKNQLPISRFAFIVSNKVSKSAVKRNKIKRQMREAIRAKVPSIKNGYDIVFIANPPVIKKNYHGIVEAVERLLINGKLIII